MSNVYIKRTKNPEASMVRRSSKWLAGMMMVAGSVGCSGDGGSGPDPQVNGSITGAVSEGGTGVAGAQLTVSGPASRSATTNAGGEYAFTGLAAGGYSVSIAPPSGFELAAGQQSPRAVTLGAGQTQVVNWSLARTTGGNVQEIRLTASSFLPADVTIQAGTTVRWVVDVGAHTVTPDNPTQAGVWADRSLSAGQSFQHTFTTAGEFNYHCVPHRAVGMVGVVRVQ
jgi:plastocyanin